ncbi:hypothetical protein [Clostridium sp. 001]|uniref:hypothetical protein n=1 Tax=Clostridium sp. 001 TaxID=1970093 RepID=UPI001C2C4083|nr:hypothetical protein [Clostridium sp. 001]QXE20444.1 hypothetical protein B5S50_17245 [Clostridium sp. 001]
MKKIVYKCLNKECNTEFIGYDKDGLCCPKCGSSVIPICDAWHYNKGAADAAYKKAVKDKQLKEKYKKRICEFIDNCNSKSLNLREEKLYDSFGEEIRFEFKGLYREKELK